MVLKSLIYFVALFILLTWTFVMGQSIRPSYWATDYISFMQHRGYLWDLSPLEQPYQLQDIEKILDAGYWLLNKKSVIEDFKGRLQYFSRIFRGEDETLFLWLQSGNQYYSSDGVDYYLGRQRGTVGIKVTPWLQVFDTFYLDNRLDENPQYLGKRQSGYASYTKQAYGLASFKGFQFKFGRDFIRWGRGRDASLLISDFSRPMDFFSASYSSRYFKFSYFTASLDPTQYALGSK